MDYQVDLLTYLIKRVKYVFFRIEKSNQNLTCLIKRVYRVDSFN